MARTDAGVARGHEWPWAGKGTVKCGLTSTDFQCALRWLHCYERCRFIHGDEFTMHPLIYVYVYTHALVIELLF